MSENVDPYGNTIVTTTFATNLPADEKISPMSGVTFVPAAVPSRLTDGDVQRIADAVVAKLAERESRVSRAVVDELQSRRRKSPDVTAR